MLSLRCKWVATQTQGRHTMANGNGNANVNATTTESTTLVYRRQHPGGGALGRCSYGIAGCKGIVVVDMALFAPALLAANNGLPPATLTLVGVAMAVPTVRTAAGVTSAVVAAANTVAGAVAAAPAIAVPTQVAQVAAAAGAAVVAAAATNTPAHAAAARGATQAAQGNGQARRRA